MQPRWSALLLMPFFFLGCSRTPPAPVASDPSTRIAVEELGHEDTLKERVQKFLGANPDLPKVAGLETNDGTSLPTVERLEGEGDIPLDQKSRDDLRAIIPPNETFATDLSPGRTLRNMICERGGENLCLPSLENPVEQAVGFYDFDPGLGVGGRLTHSVELPADGNGFHQKTDSRVGRYSTDHTVKFVQNLSEQLVAEQVTDLLIVGDISKQGGGFFPPHVSHQNGLDVDLGYIQVGATETDHEHFAKNLVSGHRLSSRFSVAQNWKLVADAVNTNWTYLILAHPAVKKAFCKMAETSPNPDFYATVLAQIVPDSTHTDHFHVRLKCPESSPRCIPGPPRLNKTGCDFSD